MTFEACSGKGKDLDPGVCKFARKIMILARTIAKYPEADEKVKKIVVGYNKRKRKEKKSLNKIN